MLLTTLQTNQVNGFSWNGYVGQATINNCLDCFTLDQCVRVLQVGGARCLLAALWEHRWRNFHEILRVALDLTQGTICSILGILCITYWIQKCCFLFMNPRVLATLRKIIEWIFMKFSGYVRPDARSNWLDCSGPNTLYHAPQTRWGWGLRSRRVPGCYLVL